MNINYLLGFQIATDFLILIVFLFLLVKLNKLIKSVSIEINEKTIHEFNQLLNESNNSANKFLEELKYEKNALQDLLSSIEQKEKIIKSLINKIKSDDYQDLTFSTMPKESFSEENYREILSLAKKGLNEEQISQQSGLPEGEIDLILNLSRAKNK